MIEYKCINCGEIKYGAGVVNYSETCEKCGSALEVYKIKEERSDFQ